MGPGRNRRRTEEPGAGHSTARCRQLCRYPVVPKVPGLPLEERRVRAAARALACAGQLAGRAPARARQAPGGKSFQGTQHSHQGPGPDGPRTVDGEGWRRSRLIMAAGPGGPEET